ncbi:hypothetical protein D8Y22_03130 [Salinadaptatus halalkaliphilus]|uniref:DUF2206 domain-containing protein n=1 Tax=Salinadaptatus halalkaliphilus TaxID=2419781 RepID=A0A4S3TPN8_9EURY|nr:hypothetical protein [Salinadaptatus halalkaliphilus]THE66281.1 hypothetical protein D8Y22_03130 [Salinadaptatus halalkaliphilus]
MKRATLEVTAAVGYLAVAFGLAIARATPATTYEASVYTGTPAVVWLAFALALAIAVGTTLAASGRQQGFAIALGAMVVTSIVSLPVVRNYRFSGMGDALTHLGWTQDLVYGELLPHELFYPAVHSFGAVFHYLGGIPIERALLVTLLALFVPFLVFVPLIVRDMTGSATAVGLAAIVSWMVLPVNNIATHMGVHTNSNALFVVPAVIFAVVAYLRRRPTGDRLPLGLSPFSILIYLTSILLLLIHPQQMINVVVLVGVLAGVQLLARFRFDDHPIVDHPTTYTHAVVLGALFTLWAASNARFRDAVSGLVYGLLTEDIGASAEVDQRGASLAEIGGSLGELFVTMFLEAAIIGLIVGLFVLVTWLGWSSVTPETSAFVTYFGLALVPLGGIFLVYFVGTPTMAFRQVGFIYVILTILAGVALAQLLGGLSRAITVPGATAVLSLLLGVLLVLGLVTVYASPVIYNPSQHVTDQQLSGYESSFEYESGDHPHVGLGYDPFRFDHGLYGLEGEETLSGASAASGEVDHEAFEAGNYSGAYNDVDHYLIVTAFDVTREVDVYQELYYSQAGLEGLEYDPAVNKVISNDEFRLYAIDSDR